MKKLLSILLFCTMLAPSYGSMQFDGSGSYMQSPHSPNMEFSSANRLTVTCWFKSYGQSGGDGYKEIFGRDDVSGTQTGGYVVFLNIDGQMSFYLVTSTPGDYIFIDHGGGTGRVTDNVWHFFVGTWDGLTIAIYLDDQLIASSNFSKTWGGTSTCPFDIGASAIGSRLFNGQIDEVHIYDCLFDRTVLSSWFLSGQKSSQYADNCGILRGWYKLDEGVVGQPAGNNTNTNVKDYSGCGNDGTPIGNPIWKASPSLNYP